MSKRRDLTGQVFWRLTVVEMLWAYRKPDTKVVGTYCQCLCTCGREVVVGANSLKNGVTLSCGCWNKEASTKRMLKHGHNRGNKRSPTNKAWADMLSRCFNTKRKQYPDYGGREITVCERWREFKNFLQDMGECPPDMTLDRVDNNGHYCKENCRWATRRQQNRNRRSNRMITYGNCTLTLSEWCERLNLNYNTVKGRLSTLHWSVTRAFLTPTPKPYRVT